MKLKHFAATVGALVAVTTIAAAVAVVVDNCLGEKIAKRNYIECDAEEKEEE